MSDKYNEVLANLTAEDQIYAFEEVTHSSGITYREFKNTPKTLASFFEFGLLFPEWEFIVFNDERYSFQDIHKKAAQTANALKNAGVKKGDRVAICMANNPEYIISFMAVTSMGAVCVLLNSWWVPDEITYGLENSGATVLIGDEKRLKGLEKFTELKKIVVRPVNESNDYEDFNEFIASQSENFSEPSLDTHDNATIFYTSGSTGFPKGVLSTHRNILSTLFSWALVTTLKREVEDTDNNSESQSADETPKQQAAILHCVPLFHVTGSHSGFLMSIIAGRKMVMMSKWDPGAALQLIQDEKIGAITGVPTQTWDLLTHPERDKYDLSSFKELSGGGAPRPPEHVKKLKDGFNDAEPSIGYGLTETNAAGTLNLGKDYLLHPGSCGRAIPPVTDVAIIDENWSFIEEPKAVGEIVIKSPANMVGYWMNQEATDEVFNDDGWFKSGDLGYIDDGFVYIVDRVKDMVIRGGENISCIEVETAIYAHPSVQEAAVFGIPEERLGETLCVAICLKPSMKLSEEDLRDFLQDKLAAFKIPSLMQIAYEELPRVASGKFSKTQLRDIFVSIEQNQSQ
ncbi:class I adenylate-forming enzyme family protein [Gammaproteobacteria bacterium]|nr:class I adenylate-forming enzyme family protein [Gammaproteobacteria bacterium]